MRIHAIQTGTVAVTTKKTAVRLAVRETLGAAREEAIA
jgi:Arc/MetJ family transcription regulator